MSAPSKAATTSTGETSPESPTTARPLEMDDDDVQETGILDAEPVQRPTTVSTTAAATSPAAPAASSDETAPPPQPPRPVPEGQKNAETLKEAFPTIDLAVIKAVLTASGGRMEPAFNALLEMTDPDAAHRDQPPPPPPRPAAEPLGPTSTAQEQLEADEMYARRLAEHYDSAAGAYEARTSSGYRAGPHSRQARGPTVDDYDGYDREHSFLDDDLPVIRENLRKGFLETQTKVNSWFTNIRKRVNEHLEERDGDGQNSPPFAGRPTRGPGRRSADYDRYDADPELLSDDFAGMRFNADGTPQPNSQQPSSSYPNNLFKPPPPSKSPKPAGGRKVAFSESVEDLDAYDVSPRIQSTDNTAAAAAAAATTAGGAARTSKWQPLSSVEPSPVAETDPFSLGDSEDDKDVHKELKKATSAATADGLVDDKSKAKAEGGEPEAKKD